ncbi:putative viral membrane formation protein [Yalta virus]|nr:putative viral membrane formation protein [Yalta virus]
MIEGDVLLSKIDVDEQLNNENFTEKIKIKQRNDYYQSLITSQTPPLALNSTCLKKINSKEVFEKMILNSGKHLSTLIPEFKITRDFIFNLLKNYIYFDLTEEESRFLLQKYFSDALSVSVINEETFDLNDEGVGISESDMESESESEEEEESNEYTGENATIVDMDEDNDNNDYSLELDKEQELNYHDQRKQNGNNKNDVYVYEDEKYNNDNKNMSTNMNASTSTSANMNMSSNKNKNTNTNVNTNTNGYNTNIKNDSNNNIQKVNNVDNVKLHRSMQSTTNFSSIRSMPTENFCNKKNNILQKNNMTKEKINETKEMKKNISLFLKNALEKRSGIDKKTTIIQFLYKNNFKGKFDSSFFDMKDEEGNLIFDYELIDEWYDAIEQIEDKQKATFECSQLIITASLYGIEFLAKKIGIKELTNISSEIKDPTNIPKNLESTKRSLTNLIDNNIPNCFVLDLIFFIGNVYIKNKVGLNTL